MSRWTVRLAALVCLLSPSACAPSPDAGRETVTGLIDAVEVDVASKLPGRVSSLMVKEGDAVEKGQPLAVIESEEIVAKIEQATAAIEAARSRLALARKGARVEEKEATRKQVELARHQLGIAQKTFERVQQLRETNAVSPAKFDEAEYQFNAAKDQVAMAEAKYDMVMQGARREEIEMLEFLVRQGESTLDEVRAYHKETKQAAPIAGEVSRIILHEGELAATGYPILTLVDLRDLWATFAVREDWLAKVRQGQTIKLYIPALDREAEFTVFAIAALGDFATWRATNDKNSFDLKSFEVKARPAAAIEGLRPGMSARWTRER